MESRVVGRPPSDPFGTGGQGLRPRPGRPKMCRIEKNDQGTFPKPRVRGGPWKGRTSLVCSPHCFFFACFKSVKRGGSPRDGVFRRRTPPLLLSGIKGRRRHDRPHKSRRSHLHVFLYPPPPTPEQKKKRRGGKKSRLNGRLEGPGESRSETHKHLHARRNQL